MITVRVQCDQDGCERHFVVADHELRPRAGLRVSAGRDAVAFMSPYVVLGAGWRATGTDGEARVYCAAHAPEATRGDHGSSDRD